MAYTWDASIRRYRDSSGRLVSDSVVREIVDQLLTAGRNEAQAITRQLVQGSLTVAQWQQQMRDIVRNVHVAASSTARGGWAQMSQGDWGWTGRRVRGQYDFLGDFTVELQAATASEAGISEAGAVARAGMYVDAARGTHSQMERRTQKAGGVEEERRRLRPGSQSCEECIEAANQGWQPVGSLPAIGDTQCVTNCNCYFEYRTEA